MADNLRLLHAGRPAASAVPTKLLWLFAIDESSGEIAPPAAGAAFPAQKSSIATLAIAMAHRRLAHSLVH
jgi:hypothetical protein